MRTATSINNPIIESLMANAIQKTNSIRKMDKHWPSTFVSRDKISDFTGGAYSSGYFANLDRQGKGPKGAFRLGRKICYPIESLIEWLEEREFTPAEDNRPPLNTKN